MNETPRREPPPARDRALQILAVSAVLGLLYLGRDVLVPITVAVILSLLLAPVVRMLRGVGFGQTSSVLAAVASLGLAVAAVTAAIGVQVVRIAQDLPQYETTVTRKLATLNEVTLGRLRFIQGPAHTATVSPRPSALPVEIRAPAPDALAVVQRVLGSVWVPLESAGIVLVVLVFVMLEHEAVRDRFIRIAGGTDLRATTLALNDAGERLSRFFVSQFRVNFGVAVAVWLGLTLVGLPHALLWGVLAGVLRFVPYVGIWIAALFATALAAAVDPGWSLAIATLALFTVIELIAGQLIEPRLYGHATGLSPLSVVIAAIFWSWLWGPTGLVVSTPLTLCLVVAGRHIKALAMLDILLGDTQALTMPQRFYQRALSGDSQEIIAAARAFLKRNAFAAYCDAVLMPALALARLDLATGAITSEQQMRVRNVMVSVIGAIAGEGRRVRHRPARATVLDGATTAGQELRQQREAAFGPFQGPLTVPPGSVMLCIGLGSFADDLATELLVRVLREQGIDARHISVGDLDKPVPPESSPEGVAVVYLVSAYPSEEREQGPAVSETIRRRFPAVRLVTVYLPGMLLQPASSADTLVHADKAATSFGQAVQICLDMQPKKIVSGADA